RSPRFTPLPYTTLFRARRVADDDRLSHQPQAAGVEPLGHERALTREQQIAWRCVDGRPACGCHVDPRRAVDRADEQIEFLIALRSEEHTSELQSRFDLV